MVTETGVSKDDRDARGAAPRAAPPSLAELQALFQRAVLDGDDSVLQHIPANSRTDAEVLFGVYRHAYVGRLVEVIGNDHPLAKAYLGDQAFDRLARDYIAAYPSRSQNARWVSRHLFDHTKSAPAFAGSLQVAELIGLEAALNSAFDGPDAEAMTITALQAVPPHAWERLVFRPHPTAQRLDFASNAFDIWLALTRDDPVPDAAAEDNRVLVWRQDATPLARQLGSEEAMMWDEATKGVRFGVLCEMLATYDDAETAPLRAAQYLQGWIVSGALAGVDVEPKRKRRRARPLDTVE